MGEADKFVLNWNDFEKNIVGAYKDLRTDKDFFDCSLVCNGETFQAHRVILSACSPVFRDMLRQCAHHHPVVFMRGVRRDDMMSLLDFMYHGQASVAEQELERFLEVAEELQVQGLTLSGDGGAGDNDNEKSGGDLDTAVDDDVNDLLAGLDTDQAPPSKRVKQERTGGGQQQPGFSVRTASGEAANATVAAVQERIRVKQEQRETDRTPAQNISVQRVSNVSSVSGYTPPAGITMTRPSAPVARPMMTPVPRLQGYSPGNIATSVQQGMPTHMGPGQLLHQAQSLLAPGMQGVHPGQEHPVLHLPDLANSRYSSPGMPQQQQLLQQQHQQLQLQQQVAQMGVMPPGENDSVESYIEKTDALGSKLQCRQCKKKFNAKSKASLVAHIESTHLNMDISCDKCNKKFKATNYLKQHQKRGACSK